MFRNVYPIAFDPDSLPADKISQAAFKELLQRGLVQQADCYMSLRAANDPGCAKTR
jgi:hypothetical protein